ncbi:MAG: hypothetical protein JWM11_3002 [Planctomycetaceae bacterium]|nr:hypothetical protein [Planctomycetaceae bacterium]
MASTLELSLCPISIKANAMCVLIIPGLQQLTYIVALPRLNRAVFYKHRKYSVITISLFDFAFLIAPDSIHGC